jgi:hypothetical protein
MAYTLSPEQIALLKETYGETVDIRSDGSLWVGVEDEDGRIHNVQVGYWDPVIETAVEKAAERFPLTPEEEARVNSVYGARDWSKDSEGNFWAAARYSGDEDWGNYGTWEDIQKVVTSVEPGGQGFSLGGMLSDIWGGATGLVKETAPIWTAALAGGAAAGAFGAGSGLTAGGDALAGTTGLAAGGGVQAFPYTGAGIPGVSSVLAPEAFTLPAWSAAVPAAAAGAALATPAAATVPAVAPVASSLPAITAPQVAAGASVAGAASSILGSGAGGEADPGSLTAEQLEQTGLYDANGVPLTNTYGGTGTDLLSTAAALIKKYPGLTGAALGAMLGGMSADGSPAGTTTTVQDIPDWLKPYAVNALTAGGQALNTAQAAQTGNTAMTNAANTGLMSTISGQNLTPDTNPYLKQMYEAAAARVGNSVNSNFALKNRTGSTGAQTGELGYQLGNLASNLYGNAYNTERGLQQSAQLGLPTYQTNTNTSTFAPATSYANLIAGILGRGSQTSTPYYSNTAGGILSGALLGSQAGKLLG